MPKPPLTPEKDHVVVNDGPNKGERYDNAPDFNQSVKADANKFKTNVMNMYRDQAPEPNKNQFTDQWYEDWEQKTPQDVKDRLQNMFSRRESEKALQESYEKPENKARILANLREHNPFFKQFGDEELWKELNDRQKNYYLLKYKKKEK